MLNLPGRIYEERRGRFFIQKIPDGFSDLEIEVKELNSDKINNAKSLKTKFIHKVIETTAKAFEPNFSCQILEKNTKTWLNSNLFIRDNSQEKVIVKLASEVHNNKINADGKKILITLKEERKIKQTISRTFSRNSTTLGSSVNLHNLTNNLNIDKYPKESYFDTESRLFRQKTSEHDTTFDSLGHITHNNIYKGNYHHEISLESNIFTNELKVEKSQSDTQINKPINDVKIVSDSTSTIINPEQINSNNAEFKHTNKNNNKLNSLGLRIAFSESEDCDLESHEEALSLLFKKHEMYTKRRYSEIPPSNKRNKSSKKIISTESYSIIPDPPRKYANLTVTLSINLFISSCS